MSVFDDLRDMNARYSLDELVSVANRLLPRLLPAEGRGMKLNELVNPRLVRHLSTLGLLDEAGREGREARYERRHLLQLLVARRLMAQGYSTGAIKKLTGGARDQELESLLHGGAQLGVTLPETIVDDSLGDSVVANEMAASGSESSAGFSDGASREAFEDAPPDNAALSFLQNIRSGRKRAAMPDVAVSREAPPAPRINRSMVASPAPGSALTPAAPRYVRIALRPGLELHVGEDFELPPSVSERETLMHDALRLLQEAHKGGGRRKR
jgi:DNA-binding transcriptional MerR regulator